MRFSERELVILRALAGAALPAGQLLPAASDDTYRRIEVLLSTSPPSVAAGYRAALWGLEVATLARHGTRFSALPLERRLAVLEAWAGSEALRLAVRSLLTPLKMSHFDDPGLYRKLGCRFQVETPPSLEGARWRERISPAGVLADGETLECDVVVVGSGAGGAPVAKALAERGYAVLVLEEGEYFTRKDFNGRPLELMRKLYKKKGLTVALGNTAIPIPVGMSVGGSTTINSGTIFRLPELTLQRWRNELGLGFTSDTLAPYYDTAETFLEVAPSSKQALGRPAEKIAAGCDALGYSHHALIRNAPGCDGQGLCCFGCPTDAKRSANVSWIPAALEAGAQLLTGFKVERLVVENDRAVGVTGVARSSEDQPLRLTVRAQVVVLACGTLSTPLLLLKDNLANTSGAVGKNLSIHPASSAIGLYDEPLNAWNTVPQGYAIDEFRDEGLMFEGAQTPLDVTAVSLSSFGPAFISLMEQFERTIGFGFMVRDTSRGRVRLAANGEPRISYWLNAHDVKLMQRGFAILARVFFAGGARAVYPSVHGWQCLESLADVDAFENSAVSARHIDITAYHPLGTCRMGPDAFTSVVDLSGETHDVHNLFVCDGSAVAGPLGVNPQLTIMAMGLRAATFIERRLERLQSVSLPAAA